MEANKSGEQGCGEGSCGGGNCMASCLSPKFDASYIINKAKEIVTNPTGCWQVLKSQPETINDVYGRYVIFMAALPPLGIYLGGVISGYTAITGGIFTALISYLFSLAGLYVGAVIVEFLASKFGGSASRTDSLRLLAYSSTPNYLMGILYIIPPLAMLGLLTSLYSLYIFWNGITEMTRVPENRRLGFVGALIGCGIVLAIVLAAFNIGMFAGAPKS